MGNLNVFFQKPLGIVDSSYYESLVKNPPKKISYSGFNNFKILIKGNLFKKTFLLKLFLKKVLKVLKVSFPNAYYSNNIGDSGLIHCTRCLSKNRFPWVADFEYINQFWFGGNSNKFNNKSKKTVRKYLNSEYCKKIMPWSEWSKKNILREFPELKNKIEVVFPAVPIQTFSKNLHKKKVRFLFVGRDFEIKGGEIFLKILNTLTKKYPQVDGVIVSEVPEKFIMKYSKNKRIRFLKLLPRESLFTKIYPSSDILLYPTFSDTLGFAILEAQSFGIPVISQKTKSTHTISETIIEGKTGFIINNLKASGENRVMDPKTLNSILKKCETLICERSLRNEMSKNAKTQILNGKFSIKERNKKLGKIYFDAMKK